MAPMIPIHRAVAAVTPSDLHDIESTLAEGEKGSTDSLDRLPSGQDDRSCIIQSGQGDSDTFAQVVASVWSKNHLIAAYALIWLIAAVCSVFNNVFDALSPYVASAFQLHSYAAATGIVASIIGGLSPIPTSKLLQRFGRAYGLVVMLVIWIVGLVMLAACNNVGMFAAAQVFTSVGSAGVDYCLSVFVSDTTALRNRGFLLSFATSPDIITMWLGGPIATSLLHGIGWRWGFGIFALALPVAMIPFIVLASWNQHKAVKQGLVASQKPSISRASVFSTIWRSVLEIDLFGLLLLAAGLSLFLLSFTIYSFQHEGFKSPLIISFIVVGFSLIVIYGCYEGFFAPTTSIPFSALCDRTVLLALLTIVLTIVAFTNIIGYGGSYLQVVTGLSITQTSYLISSIRVAICVWTLLIGVLVRWTGRLKLLVLTIGVPLMFIGSGIFFNYRGPLDGNKGLGIMVAVVVLISCSFGSTVLCATLIMMAALGNDHNTTILALIVFLTNVAPALGEAINTGIWTGTFKQALHKHLPTLTEKQIHAIYSSLDVQLSFPRGSLVREGIARAYGDSKYYMLIVSLALMACAVVSTLFWRDLRAREVRDPRVVGATVSKRGSKVGNP